MILDFIKRRYIALISLLPYFALWGLCFNFFHLVAENPKSSCGAANGGMLVIMLLAMASTTVIFFVFSLISKGQKRRDFITILFITYLPLLIAVIDLAT